MRKAIFILVIAPTIALASPSGELTPKGEVALQVESPAKALPPSPDARAFNELSNSERRQLVQRSSKKELSRRIQQSAPLELIATGRKALKALGTYEYQLTKQERIGNKLQDPQTMRGQHMANPFAVRMDYLEGPGKGRRVLFNESINNEKIRAKEGGFLGVVGAIWVGVNDGLAKRDTTHSIWETGFASLFDRLERDFGTAAKHGGYRVKHEGWDKNGLHCTMFIAPKKGIVPADATRICFDLYLGLPRRIENFDGQGKLFERFEYSDVKAIKVRKDHFTLQGAKL